MKTKVGFVCNAAPFFESGYAEEKYDYILTRLKETAGKLDIEVVAPAQPVQEEEKMDEVIDLLKTEQIDALILQMGTFNTGIMPLRLCQAFQVPLALWALKEPDLSTKVPINSLCGVNLVSSSLHSLQRNYKFFYSHPEEDVVYQEITNYLKAVKAVKNMSESKVGYMGGRAIGFYPCLFDEMKLRRVFGTEVLTMGLSEVKKYLVDDNDIDIDSFEASNYPSLEGGVLSEEDILAHERTFMTLKKMVEDQGFDALTIRDWPELTNDPDLGAVWPAVGRLHDEVMITGPEGDMPGTLTMMVESFVSDEKPFLTDMVYFDEEDDTVILWHYGAAPSLAKDPEQIKYSADNSDVEFTLRSGIITISRLQETEEGYKMLISRGQVEDEDITIERAGARVKLEVSAREFLDEIIYGGWAHHVCTVEGDHVDSLLEFCNIMDIEPEILL